MKRIIIKLLNEIRNKTQKYEISEDVKQLTNNLKELIKNKKKIIIFFLFLPLTFFFLLINFLTYIVLLNFYFIIFIKKIIQNKIKIKKYKKNNKLKKIVIKDLKYEKKIIKSNNFYLICLEKIFIAHIKKRSFFIIYSILKNIFEKKIQNSSKQSLLFIIKKIFKNIIEKLLIKIITGLPYLVIYCNERLTTIFFKTINNNYENFENLIQHLIINITWQLEPYNSLIINNLKIKFNKKKIIFNIKKLEEIWKKMKIDKEFLSNFQEIKTKVELGNVKNLIEINEKTNKKTFSKEHVTIYLENEDNINYTNQTSKETIKCYNKELSKINQKNNFENEGIIKKELKTWITPNIVTKKENVIFSKNINMETFKYEKVNEILLGFIANLNKECLITQEFKIANLKKNLLINEEKKHIDFLNKNPNAINKKDLEILNELNEKYQKNLNSVEEIIKNGNKKDNLELIKNLELNQKIKKDFNNENLNTEDIEELYFEAIKKIL